MLAVKAVGVSTTPFQKGLFFWGGERTFRRGLEGPGHLLKDAPCAGKVQDGPPDNVNSPVV